MPRPTDKVTADLIVAAAAAYPVAVHRSQGADLTATLSVRHVTETLEYLLRLSVAGDKVRVREKTPARLPSFCPERHINDDGWFCLEYAEADGIRVTDAENAAAWWARLWKFLHTQRAAARMRRWPGRAWAHGLAAGHQLKAEAAAQSLGLATALAAGTLHTRRRKGFLAVYDGTRRLYSVRALAGRIATGRQGCLCGSGRPRIHCTDHADQAVALAVGLEGWRREEAAFWRAVADRPCCGTMATCPLRKSLPVPPPADGSDAALAQAA